MPVVVVYVNRFNLRQFSIYLPQLRNKQIVILNQNRMEKFKEANGCPFPAPITENLERVRRCEIAKNAARNLRKVLIIYCPIIMIASSAYLGGAKFLVESAEPKNRELYTGKWCDSVETERYVTIFFTAIMSMMSQVVGVYGACMLYPRVLSCYTVLTGILSIWYLVLTLEFSMLYIVGLTFFVEGFVFGYYLRKTLRIVLKNAQEDERDRANTLSTVSVLNTKTV